MKTQKTQKPKIVPSSIETNMSLTHVAYKPNYKSNLIYLIKPYKTIKEQKMNTNIGRVCHNRTERYCNITAKPQ